MTVPRPTGRAALAFLILLASCAAIAAPKAARRPAAALPRYGVVVFSDLCVSADSGEFGGQTSGVQRLEHLVIALMRRVHKDQAGNLLGVAAGEIANQEGTVGMADQHIRRRQLRRLEHSRQVSARLLQADRRRAGLALAIAGTRVDENLGPRRQLRRHPPPGAQVHAEARLEHHRGLLLLVTHANRMQLAAADVEHLFVHGRRSCTRRLGLGMGKRREAEAGQQNQQGCARD